MALITFYGFAGGAAVNLNSSGLGFFGSGAFGTSVAVGQYQDATYITSADGNTGSILVGNVKYINTSGAALGATTLQLNQVPNSNATLNIHFAHTSAVQVRNASLRIYDRVSADNGAVGVVTKVGELIHTSPSTAVIGSGDINWITPSGSTNPVTLANSPGPSGVNALDGVASTYSGVAHDWYVAISASPTTIGSKTAYGLYISLEYL